MPTEEKNNTETSLGGGENITPEAPTITDQEINSIQPGKAHPTDPDFLIILTIAFFNDVFVDLIMDLIGIETVILPILSKVADFFTGAIVSLWMYWKSKQFTLPDGIAQKLKGMESKVMTKIQAKIQKKVASKAVKKALIRTGGALVIEAIPGVNLFTSWTVTVLSML